MRSYDLIVIGSGAGLIVANGAAEAGLKVALIEKGPLGGTCLNRGCIPSKIIIHSADVADEIQQAQRFGLSAALKQINFSVVTSRASHIVNSDAHEIETSLRSGKNPRLYQGTARFVASSIIEVSGQTLKGKKILIAAGARPTIPPIPGLKNVPYLTSTEALRETKLPKSMIIIGGGYIACELGHFYGALGCRVTIIQRSSFLMPREDEEVARTFTKIWQKRYQIILHATVTNVEKKGNAVAVKLQGGRTVSAEKLLVATGVTPNSDLLDVKKARIAMNKKGFIMVNKYLETSAKNIWALGDIAGKYLFRHSANLEAEYVLQNILGKHLPVDYEPMPHAIFTSPQVAGVGLTEQQCREKKNQYVVGKYDYKDTAMGVALAEREGFCKFLVDKRTQEILGCHIIGPHASIAIHEVCVAMNASRKKALEIIQKTVHVHPALNEVVQRAALSIRHYPKSE